MRKIKDSEIYFFMTELVPPFYSSSTVTTEKKIRVHAVLHKT